MKNNSRLYALVFHLLLPLLVFAQEKKNKTEDVFLWGSFGSSLSYSGNFYSIPGLRVSIDGSYSQKIFFEFQYDDHQRSEPHDYMVEPDPPPNRLIRLYNKSIMIGYGKYILPQLALIGYSGISWGSGVYRGEYHLENGVPSFTLGSWKSKIYKYEMDIFRYTGIPFNLKLLWTGLHSGFGLDLYYNYHKHSDYGIILGGNIGKIRNPSY